LAVENVEVGWDFEVFEEGAGLHETVMVETERDCVAVGFEKWVAAAEGALVAKRVQVGVGLVDIEVVVVAGHVALEMGRVVVSDMETAEPATGQVGQFQPHRDSALVVEDEGHSGSEQRVDHSGEQY